MFAATQSAFASGLLDPERALPEGLTAHGGGVPAKRFAVYRNNVVVGLVEALRMRFPAVEKIVGEEFFAAMARVFVAAHPPRSPLLMHYGDDLAGFIAQFPPTGDLPYLPDVARLEAARTRAYHAADAAPVNAAALRALDPSLLPMLRVQLHPSVQIVRSPYPIVTIWAMNSGEMALAPIEAWHAQDALVVRPHSIVTVRSLPAGGAAFVLALEAGATLGAAAEQAMCAGFDLTANLAGLIGSGAMAGLLTSDGLTP
jgi:hypothetical protein